MGACQRQHGSPFMAELALAGIDPDDGTAGNCLGFRLDSRLLQILFQPRHIVVLLRLERGALHGRLPELLELLTAINAGKHAKFLFERLHKGVAVGKSGIRGNGLDRPIGMKQQIYRVIQTNPGQVAQE